jgi:hypothetical protein
LGDFGDAKDPITLVWWVQSEIIVAMIDEKHMWIESILEEFREV